MRKRRFAGFIVVLLLLLVFGCNNNPTGTDISLDEEAIKDYILNNDEGFFSFEAHYGLQDTTVAATGNRAIPGPKTWWRELRDRDRQISINIVNDSAFVTISNRVEGVFHILQIDTIATPDTIIHYEKDLGDNLVGYAIFRRLYCSDCLSRGWGLTSLTGVKVNSDSVTVEIDSIRINCNSYTDTVITTPWMFFDRGYIFTFGKQEEVVLTIYSSGNVYAFPHARNIGDAWRRWKFTEVEPGVWQGVWVTPAIRGVKVVGFDILHKNTIDDEVYNYDSNVWLFSYRVE
jgi:hypothetical protein